MISCNIETKKTSDNNNFTVKLIVDYGDSKVNLEKNITTQRQLTTLEALQYASIVETHPVGKHVFVSSIDSVQTIRGVKAWYYKVNGESPEVLSINNKINNGDTIRWLYKKDVCSHTIDNK
ncbi:MAG: DUF4430 domain-containing protein [Bacteroidota bacterium]|nr:DUF4430 domain-containing protein [Bacteroidota bacterium]